jgi:hypothetical protein
MSRFDDVAKMLADDKPPSWLASALEWFARMIGAQTNSDETVERNLLSSAFYLQGWLAIYGRMEKKYGIKTPVCVDEVSNALEELIPFLAEQLRHPRLGGKVPDDRRPLCASVCTEAYRLLHGNLKPHSSDLRAACEALWLACGNPSTGTVEGAVAGADVGDNWRRFLERVAVGDDWVRSRFDVVRNQHEKITS